MESATRIESRDQITKIGCPGNKLKLAILIYVDDTRTHNVTREEMVAIQEELMKGGLEVHKQNCLSVPLSKKIIDKYGKERRVYKPK